MPSSKITHRALLRHDKTIGHLFTPNLCMRQPYSEKPHYIRTNAQGFRANFDFNPNSDDQPKIAFVGDSYTAGDGVANEKRFSDLVGRAIGGYSYNFGLSGSGVDQQYLIYQRMAREYPHDLLVLSPHISDISRNMLESRISVDGQTGQQIRVPKPYFTIENDVLELHNVPVPKDREEVEEMESQEKLFQPNDFVRDMFHKFVPQPVKEKLLKLQFSKQHGGYESEDDERWVLMRKLLEATIEYAGDIPIILAPLPYHRIDKNPEYKERFIHLAAQYDNVHFLDILEKFANEKDTDRLYFSKDAHYSEYGHEVIADAIVDFIANEKLLPQVTASSHLPQNGHTPTKATYILGISAFYHDSASALIKDGEIVAAAQEERFTRVKNDAGFPIRSINYCLEEAQIHMSELDAVVFYDHPYLTLERLIAAQIAAYPAGIEIWRTALPRWLQTKMHIPKLIRTELDWSGDVYLANHHLSHAASAFYPSPFTEAAILTVDGVGEWATATIGHGQGNSVEILKEMNFPHSVGLLYSAFTYYTGFKVNEGEYKLMGLAPYGEPVYVDIIKEKIVDIHDDGSITLNMEYFNFRKKARMISEKFEQLFGQPGLARPARQQNEDITKHTRDMAKSIQVVVEEIIIKMARHAQELTGAKRLCMAGGVALNCVANGKLLQEGIFEDVWIQPAAGDAGCSLGAAMALFYEKFNAAGVEREEGMILQKGSYWGPSYTDEEVQAYLDTFDYQYTIVSPKERNAIVAQYLSEQKIVGHFSDRGEFGPRALGNRSILGDPRSETAQSVLNLKIKFRESFRPFAPSVLEERVSDYFELDKPSPYMLLVAPVNPDRCIPREEGYEHDLIKIVNKKRSDLPAITHIDYSARVQSVSPDMNPIYYEVIREFEKRTGYGVVINTSFNVNGEPIVCTPKDAVTCFMTTNMDVLVINNFILIKEEQKERDLEKLKFKRVNGVVDHSKARAKAKKEAERLFEKYFPVFAEHKKFVENFADHLDSTWKDARVGEHFDVIHPDFIKQPDDILRQWIALPQEVHEEYREFLQELIDLSNKYRIEEVSDIGEEVSDSIYVMF